MSSRSVSPTPSNSSAGSGADEDGAARLAQLEALLNASLGYDGPAPAAEEPPKKKRKHDNNLAEEPAAAPVATAAVESAPVEMAFRLFSTQKTPQTVVIDEVEVNEVVEDPRIRDVADEPKAVVKQRAKDIALVAVSGEAIRGQSSSLPPSHFPPRLTLRLSTLKPSAPAPPLAYLDASLHPKVAPTTKPNLKSKRSQRKARKPQAPRHPHPDPQKVALKVTAFKAVPAKAEGVRKAGRRRLSKERRIVQRKKGAEEMVRKAMAAVEPGA